MPDLIIACGDLPFYYIEYIVTLLPKPVCYVFGNHDKPVNMSDGRRVEKPEGAINLDGATAEINGVLLAGLGGSMRYQPDKVHQYSEMDMRQRFLGLIPKLMINKLRYGRYLDIFVAHSPPKDIHDGDDLPHRGFKTFLTLMRYFKPQMMLHGHMHIYRQDTVTETRYNQTDVINVYPSRTVMFTPRSDT